jgi:UDP-glucose 4-epimerase
MKNTYIPKKTKSVVVTGGAGFIGSHLVDRLADDGHKVRVVDNFAKGNIDNLLKVRNNPNVTVHEMDVTDYESILGIMRDAGWVFHLAALADIVPSIQAPLDYHKANVLGTVSVLEAARLANVNRFVYAASSSCYGIPDRFPTSETASNDPKYPYALTKLMGEQYVTHWNQVYGLPTASLRLFNVFGPRARTSGTYGAVFGVLLAQKLAGRPLTIVGDGNQTRDFTFVSDVVDALITAAQSERTGETFNVGSGGTYSVNHLADLIGGERVYIPKRPGEPDCTLADITKIKNLLGWTPKVQFDDGVRLVLDDIQAWKGAPVWEADSIAKATKDWFKFLGNDH